MSRLNQRQRAGIHVINVSAQTIMLSLQALLATSYKALTVILFILTSLFYTSVQAATNTGLTGDDRYAGRFPIGFNFQFYDKTYDRFYVSTNGLIQFSMPTTSYNNQCLPAEFDNTLYVFWDDLRTDVAGQPVGKIEYETLGQAPNRKLVVQWTNQYFFGSNMPMGTFQAILFEGTNQIKYQYRSLLDEQSHGTNATIGIQYSATQFEQVSCNQANALQPGQAITFTPTEDGSGYVVDTDADYDFIDIAAITLDYPLPVARYTRLAPVWEWNKTAALNAYQIEIQTPDGISLHQETLGNVDSYQYDAGLEHGKTYRARIRGSSDNGQTWEAWSGLSSFITVDLISPKADLNSFARTSSNEATVTYQAADDLSGLRTIQLQIAANANFTNVLLETTLPVNQTQSKLSQLPQSNTLFARVRATDRAGNQSDYSAAVELAIASPYLITPVNGTVTDEPFITISGTSYPNSNVVLYLNDTAIDTLITTDENGYFSADIALDTEQSYSLTAQAQTPLGNSPLSYEVIFSYKVTPATVIFATPIEGSVLTGPTEITVVASDKSGIAKVDIYSDETLLGSLTEAPYSLMWQLTDADNGSHTLKAVVTTGNGKTYEAFNQVDVEVLPPTLPPTPYTGLLNSIEPAVSYGQAVVIEGQAIERDSSELMANVPLQLVLINNGFKRTIAISTEDNGQFIYSFIPQSTDKGTYSVAVIHPSETVTPVQGEFAINRISFNINGYRLKAARNVTAKITVNASANLGTQGLRWIMRAEDQPNGQLPQGITIDGGQGINIAANATAPTEIEFTADDSAADTGNVFLVAIADDSGDIVRGKLQIQYQLTQAQPALYTTPNFIQTGVAQEGNVTEVLMLANRGLIAAENVRIKLLDTEGATPPSWVFLASETDIGTVNLDDTISLNITAQPDSSVTDGIYYFRLHISADNQSEIIIPITVSVVQNGLGGIRFDVADIYTATLDENGQPILGVANATIKLQNDAVLTEQYTLTTDTNGIATAEQLPPGIYLYRASAPKHTDASGRVRVRPGVTGNEHIFLDYEIINVEFSVTETTIKDVYDVNLDVTFNANVPAPVVILEPRSVNLYGMQIGEEKTGQLTLTNYGLVRADNLEFNFPESDDRFSYEFFGDIPTQLAPKTRVVIPYKVTKLKESPTLSARSLLKWFSDSETASSVNSCASYAKDATTNYKYTCANGDESKGSDRSRYHETTGPGCDKEKWDGSKDKEGENNSGVSNQPIALSKTCTPDCTTCCRIGQGDGSTG